MSRTGPRVERVGPGEVAVTFVDDPGEGTSVSLAVVIGPNIGFNPIEEQLVPVSGTPLHELTLRMRSDLRVAYVFRRTGPDGEVRQVSDPFNPPPPFADCAVERFSGASVLTLPDAAPLPWLDEAQAAPSPEVEPELFASEVLGNTRRIWVSMPPGELPAGAALPYMIHLDGTPQHSAPSVRDALVRAGLVRPCAVVLVDPLGDERYAELLCNPEFSRMLVTELVPWLRARHPLSADPRDVALAGESFGGLCAGWTALHHPTTFGNAILQSPSCGYHPDRVWGTGAGELLRRNPVPILMSDLLDADPVPIRVFHDVGELEGSLCDSRWLDHVLTGKGYDTRYLEFAGGHDYAWWRGLLADALQWCFTPEPGPGADD